jgi:hypothetical protein
VKSIITLVHGLILAGKARYVSYTEAPKRCFSKVSSALTQNFNLGWKVFLGTDSSSFCHIIRDEEKRFIVLTTVANVINFFTAFHNKLERLSTASLSSLV